MAIDLPETFPAIFKSFKKSNSLSSFDKTLKKFKKSSKSKNNLKSDGKQPRQNIYNNRNFENNNPEHEFEQSLLTGVDTRTSLDTNLEVKYEPTNPWLQDNDNQDSDEWCEQYYPRKKSVRHDNGRYYEKSKDGENLLGAWRSDKRQRRKVFIWEGIGFTFLCISLFLHFAGPFEYLLELNLMFAPNTAVFNLWKAPPVKIIVRSYIFNVTNPIEFLAGKEKMKMEEIGPFAYTEEVENHNATFNDNGTVTYIPTRKVTPLPELSIGDPKDFDIIVPNIAMLGIISMLSNSSIFTNFALLPLLKMTGSQPFLNITAYEYLWGYDDPLIKVANKLVSSWIPFEKLGILDRLFDDGINHVTMRLSDNGLNVTDPGYLPQYSIDSFNGVVGLSAWGYNAKDFQNRSEPMRPTPVERCKLIRGAMEGVIFPRNMKKNMTFQIYRKAFCRILPIVYDREGLTDRGVPGYWFKLPDNVFDTEATNPEMGCYCNSSKRRCLPRGLSEITPCYYNIPTAVSFPHFYNGDPALLTAIDGLKPDKSKHGTEVILQQNLGVAMELHTRIQTNLVMGRTKYIPKGKPFNDLIIPLFWVDLSVDSLPPQLSFLLDIITFVIPVIKTSFIVICVVLGITIISYTTVRYFIYQHNSSNKYSAVKLTPITKTTQIVTSLSRRGSMAIASRKNSLVSTRRNSAMHPL